MPREMTVTDAYDLFALSSSRLARHMAEPSPVVEHSAETLRILQRLIELARVFDPTFDPSKP